MNMDSELDPMDDEFINFLISVIGPPPKDLLDDAGCEDCPKRDDCSLRRVVEEEGI